MDFIAFVSIPLLDLRLGFGFCLGLYTKLLKFELPLALLGLLLFELLLRFKACLLIGFVGFDLEHLFVFLLDLLLLFLELVEQFLLFGRLRLHGLRLLDELMNGVPDLLLERLHVVFHRFFVLLLVLLLLFVFIRMRLAPNFVLEVLGLLKLFSGVFIDCFARGLVLGRLGRHSLRELIEEGLVLLADSCISDFFL